MLTSRANSRAEGNIFNEMYVNVVIVLSLILMVAEGSNFWQLMFDSDETDLVEFNALTYLGGLWNGQLK